MIKYILTILSIISLYSCSSTRPVVNEQGLVRLSNDGDYIRPIRTSNGYYYNDPRNGRVVRMPIKR